MRIFLSSNYGKVKSTQTKNKQIKKKKKKEKKEREKKKKRALYSLTLKTCFPGIPVVAQYVKKLT